MKKLYLINELRYQTKYLFWHLPRLLEVRTTSGITKYLADDKPPCGTTYSGETEWGCLVLILKPLCIHIRQEGQLPETKTHQAKAHKTCHSSEAGALIISQTEVLLRISYTQFCSKAHGIKGDDLPGSQCEIGGEQNDVFPCSLKLTLHYTHLLDDIPNPYISCHYTKSSQFAIDEYCDTFCWEAVALKQVCQLPFFALSGVSPRSSHLLLARWQWWFGFWIIPSHCILAHTRYDVDGYPKHPVDEWRFGEVSISYHTHGCMLQHGRELGNKWTNSIPEFHCSCSTAGIHNEPNGIGIARDQVSQYGEAQRRPLFRYERGAQQSNESPMMA
jgi:hypothetical protein